MDKDTQLRYTISIVTWGWVALVTMTLILFCH